MRRESVGTRIAIGSEKTPRRHPTTITMTLTGNTVACITNPDTDHDTTIELTVVAGNNDFGMKRVPVGTDPAEINWDDIAVAVAVGGDGTFLEGVRLTHQSGTPLLAVNDGSLGFLARIEPEKAGNALNAVLSGNADIINREMLTVSGDVSGTGINDVMVEPLSPDNPTDRKITTVHAYIDDTYVGEYTGSGIAVSTPTGSTGVAISSGGPVHYPNANSSLQLTPLQTHNTGVRPVIVDSTTTIRLLPETDVTVSIDGGRTHETISEGDEITVTGADTTAKIVRTLFDESFFDSMVSGLGWGIRDVNDPGPLPHPN